MVRALGINHVALEVGDIDEALAWYGRLFAFELRGKRPTMAWMDLGDQFIALSAGRMQAPDDHRHFGLVVDDKEALRAALQGKGIPVGSSGPVRFRDPWGNNWEAVDYRQVQFTKAPEVLRGMGVTGLEKTDEARAELRAKGLEGG